MSTLDRLFAESEGLADYAARYAEHLATLLSGLDVEAVERVGIAFETARRAGRTIFLLGNGGSAATASHFANDLGFGPRALGGEAYRAISLSDNMAFFSAVGNDAGYDMVFVEGLKTLMKPGDVVVGISASGNSPNVIRAIEYAKAHGAVTIGLVGFDGGALLNLADEVVHIATPPGDYGPVEDVHMILDHLLTTYLARMTRAASKSGEAVPARRPCKSLVELQV
jgi:D-sedoheptulose 7-phosphate isomerase